MPLINSFNTHDFSLDVNPLNSRSSAPKSKLRPKWLRIIGWTSFFALIGFVAFGVISAVAYYTPSAADLPCRNVTGDARSVHVNGFDLYYRELGTNNTHDPPIVILHGGPGHSSTSFKGGFDFLASQYHVVYYDQRGSGNSQILPDVSKYTIDQLVEELDTLRAIQVNADKIILVGHSFGGALAQRYAIAHPEHVARLILVSSVSINNGITVPWLWDVFSPILFTFGAGFPPADPVAANEWFAKINYQTSIPRLYNQSTISIIENSGYISFATWREVSRSVEGLDYKSELENLTIPALVTYGTADSSATGESNAHALCSMLSNCTLARFEKSGHWAFLEEPANFHRVMLSFLNNTLVSSG